MLRVTKVTSPSHGIQPTHTITLCFVDRHRRRHLMKTDQGLEFLLDLPLTTLLREGDLLLPNETDIIIVKERPEALVKIQAKDLQTLISIAWHLGNAHCAVQIQKDSILMPKNRVFEKQVEDLGGKIQAINAPFTPQTVGYPHG